MVATSSTKQEMISSFDDRRNIAIPGSAKATLDFCVEHFIGIAKDAIKSNGKFCVALSGGTTPKAIFQKLTAAPYRDRLDWKHVYLFWSDERCVPPTDPESNYKMAMDAGFSQVPIPAKNIFRMPAEREDVVEAAEEYERKIREVVPAHNFDLVMLGMGEDGHTASLFPKTHGLHTEDDRLVIANFIPQKEVWRMSFTYQCINAAHHIAIYAMGKSKAAMVKKVLTGPYDPDNLPIQRVGTRMHKALWILDTDAANSLMK